MLYFHLLMLVTPCSVPVQLFATPWTLCSPPGSSIHGTFQARILEWVDVSYSRVSFQPRNQTSVSCCCSQAFRGTNSLRRIMQLWSAVYYTSGPKAESPLSLGPRPVFLKTLYTLSVHAKPTSPNSLKLVWTKEKKDTLKVNLWFICLKPR